MVNPMADGIANGIANGACIMIHGLIVFCSIGPRHLKPYPVHDSALAWAASGPGAISQFHQASA